MGSQCRRTGAVWVRGRKIGSGMKRAKRGIGRSEIETRGGSRKVTKSKGLTREVKSCVWMLMPWAKLAESVHEEKRSQAGG